MSILNDMQGKLVADFASDPKSRDDCQKEVINIARAALNYRNVSGATEKSGAILIGALEHSCKFYLGLTGLGAIATTYSVAKCFYEYADDVSNDVGFIACLAGEAIGAGVGAAGEKLGVEEVRQAIVDRVTDAGVDKLKDEINSRRSAISNNEVDISETTLGDGCKVQLSILWTKARNPAREQRSNGRAGTITVSVGISDCKCSLNRPYSQQLRNGSLVVNVPVNFVANASAQPSWQADFARMRVNLQATCCSGQVTRWGDPPRTDPRGPTDGPTGTTGKTGGTVTGGGTGTTGGTGVTGGTGITPPWKPPVTPPPVTPKPRPAPEGTKPIVPVCPECVPRADAVNRATDSFSGLQAQRPALQKEIGQHHGDAEDARRRIRALEQMLNAYRGEGGSAYDPSTGITVTATNNGDGTVTVTTTGSDGKVLERHTRDSQSAKDAQKQLPAEKQREADAVGAEAAAQKRLAQLEASIRQAAAAVAAAEAALADCLKRCRGTVVLEQVVNRIGNNPFDPQNPLSAGPGIPPTAVAPQVPGTPQPPGTPPPQSGCTTPQPPSESQTQACPAGQTGTIIQTRSYSCVGTAWVPGAYQTTSNTCTGTPPPQGCTTPQPPSESQTLSCPAGQVGTIIQTRSYSCVGSTWTPGAYQTTSNTCATPPPTGCATNFSSGNYACSGSCGISSAGLTVVSGNSTMTAGTFGSNTNVGFSCAGPSANSQSTNLIILGAPGHRCTLTGLTLNSLGVLCQNTSGGSCTSSCSR